MLKHLNTSFIRLFATLFIVAESLIASAGPGDTTWVTVFDSLKLDHYGAYDTTVAFPASKRYRKIRMHYILGRYACPGNPQYCGSWDYTTEVFALPKTKDTVEIARIITPYATDWLTKKITHDYIVDVTDYASALEDSTHMRFRYEGYSWGFLLTLKLEFIEGIPPRDAISVKNVYNGYFAYGSATNTIENYLTAKTLSYTTPYAELKNTISGHGSDNTGCSEFCDKYYQLLINGNQVAQKQIWRSDCGSNEVYPQTGTWVFERGGWCPGAVVWPIYHPLKGITNPLSSFTANIDMQAYTSPGGSLGGYNFVTQLVSYGNFNNSRDVSLEDIVAPASDRNYYRENPACMNPIIKIRNTGSDTVKSVELEYGIPGRVPFTYTYTGVLSPLETIQIVLPASGPVMAHTVPEQFEARIVGVNGLAGDDYADNDVYASKTTTVSLAPKDFVVKMSTNGSSSGGISETSWTLYDENNFVIAERTNAGAYKNYNDTIRGLADGCYKFVVNDSGCDGYSWWYYQYYPVNPGNGTVRIDKIDQIGVIFNFPGDVGCGTSKYFYVGNYPALPGHVGITETDLANRVSLFPNPASGFALLQFNLENSANVSYSITDITGKKLSSRNLGNIDLHYEKISLTGIAAGVYFVRIEVPGEAPAVKKLVVD